MTAAWMVNESHSYKMVHRPECRHARTAHPYNWAGDRDANDLAAAIIRNGSDTWHKGCRRCAIDLEMALVFGPTEHPAEQEEPEWTL